MPIAVRPFDFELGCANVARRSSRRRFCEKGRCVRVPGASTKGGRSKVDTHRCFVHYNRRWARAANRRLTSPPLDSLLLIATAGAGTLPPGANPSHHAKPTLQFQCSTIINPQLIFPHPLTQISQTTLYNNQVKSDSQKICILHKVSRNNLLQSIEYIIYLYIITL